MTMELANLSSYWIQEADCIQFDSWDQFTNNCFEGCPAYWKNFVPLIWGVKQEGNKWKIQLVYINPYDIPHLLTGHSEFLRNTFERRIIECNISDKDVQNIKNWLTKIQASLWKLPVKN